MAVEEPEAGVGEGELERVRLAGRKRQDLRGPAGAVERSGRYVGEGAWGIIRESPSMRTRRPLTEIATR